MILFFQEIYLFNLIVMGNMNAKAGDTGIYEMTCKWGEHGKIRMATV